VEILYPKSTDKDLYLRLVKQCQKYSIDFIKELECEKYDLIIDSIFGFSFKGDIRQPFDIIITV
jgi:NAD(P)H-hydrate epimerase